MLLKRIVSVKSDGYSNLTNMQSLLDPTCTRMMLIWVEADADMYVHANIGDVKCDSRVCQAGCVALPRRA